MSFSSFVQKYNFARKAKTMKIKCLFIAKTDDSWIREGTAVYLKRLKHYATVEWVEIPALKQAGKLTEPLQKKQEGELLLKQLAPGDKLILLDERGKTYSSEAFSGFIQQNMNSGIKQLVFVTGGPFGFSEEVYQRANGLLSLSAMTFSHQMIRVVFAEQLYRAFTIIKGEPYHHR